MEQTKNRDRMTKGEKATPYLYRKRCIIVKQCNEMNDGKATTKTNMAVRHFAMEEEWDEMI